MRKPILAAVVAVALGASAIACDEELSVKDVSPKSGVIMGGEPVEIRGSGFKPGMDVEVSFGNIEASSVAVKDSSTIVATTPSGAQAGWVDIFVRMGDGRQFKIHDGFQYIEKGAMDIRDLGKVKSRR